MSINRVILVGNAGQDPEIKGKRSGGKMASLSLATNKRWTDKLTGEKMENTTWHRIVTFDDNLVEEIKRTIKKGSRVYVEGELATRKWIPDDGVERFVTEIVVRSNGRIESIEHMKSNIESGGNHPFAPDDPSAYGNPRPVGQRQSARDESGKVPF